ncbi:hypothetical protein GX48_07643 [Paracoccidioides brasiliensis]|nr:hypothetical protein GX48_07643 [Paracoccidioides brasiliensis]
MSHPTLSHGLNLPGKKPQPVSLPKANTVNPQKRKKTIFDSDSEDGDGPKETNGSVEITTIGDLNDDSNFPSDEPSSKRPANSKRKSPAPQTLNYTNLSSLHSSKKHAQTAESLDSTIYDYDAVYDSLHVKKLSTTSSSSAQAVSTPKYMTALFRSAEIRKRDQLRARDKQLQREREAEGEEYAGKEKFVTAAYKAQQEEARRIEAEEAEREREEQERRREGVGMVGFYKNMLERDEKRHEEMVRWAAEAAATAASGEKEMEKEVDEDEKTDSQIAAELNARGANIILNDEGQIVDKRELLTAGLNVVHKPNKERMATVSEKSGWGGADRRRGGLEIGGSGRAAQRARQTGMLAAQLEERMRKEAEEEEKKAKELAEKTRSSKTERDVQSARERYLARKREREKEK